MKLKHVRRYWGLGVVAALLGAFGFVAEDVLEGETHEFDMSVLLSLRQEGQPELPIGPHWLPEAARDVTALGSFSVLGILVIVVVAYLLMAHRRGTAILVASSVLGGTIISNTLKIWFDRPRPELIGVPEVFTASFPSGHSLIGAVTYLTIGAVLAASTSSHAMRAFYIGTAISLTFIVGISRLYLGVHYPTDVFAGWCLGGAWALTCFIIGHIWQKRLHETSAQ